MLISDWSSDVCSSDLYDRAFSGRCTIDEMFAGQGLSPDIVLEAIDADVVKTYADIGLGIGIIAGVAFDPRRDKGLVGLPPGHLFGPPTTSAALTRGVFLGDYVYVLLVMLASPLTRDVVSGVVSPTRPPVALRREV